MKFKVCTSSSIFTEEEAGGLEKLGFTFHANLHGRRCLDAGSVEVEISTLEELIAFSREWGELIVSDGEIEIYDTYRE